MPTAEAEAFTISTVPARFAAIGDPGAGIDGAVGSLEALLELSRRDEAEGLGDAPWPPNYRKQEGEPPRVQPSKQRRATADYDTPEAEAEREKNRAAMEKRFTAELERRAAAKAAGEATPATRPTPTGRRRSSVPVIEISRAKSKAEALEGLERWKARHPEAGRGARGGGRARRRDARPLLALVPGPRESHPRAGRRTARPRKPSTRTTTRGPSTRSRTAPGSSSARRNGSAPRAEPER